MISSAGFILQNTVYEIEVAFFHDLLNHPPFFALRAYSVGVRPVTVLNTREK